MLISGNILDGRYQIQRQIGGGGFGAVYLAEDLRFSGKNLVAVKEIQPRSESEAKSLRQEADLLYNLNHPNLPKVSNSFQEAGAYFIVMDYISGEDLAEMLKRGKKFTLEEVLRIADTVLNALEYLHSFPIFHRDIKPHNIKIDETGKIFLLDFGTAKGNLEDDTHTKAGQSITGFTPFYAPLEQVLRVDTNSFLILQAEHAENLERFANYRTDERSDIYALGATLYHLLSGNSPQTATSTFRARAFWSNQPDPLPLLSEINAEVPFGIAKAVENAMAIEPSARFQTANAFRMALLQNSDNQTADKTVRLPEPTEILSSDDAGNKISEDWNVSAPLPTKNIVEIPVQEEIKPIEELFPPPENKKSSGKKLVFGVLGGVFVIFLLILAGGGVWLLKTRPSNANPVASGNVNSAETAKNANKPNPAPETPVRTLDYSLLVQKMRDGKEYLEPFESSGQEIFENGYKFQMRMSPSEDGFLYIFNEGLNDKSEKVYQVIFPTPMRNSGNSAVKASQKIETGWNQFGGKAGTERFWIVWSKDNPQDIEKVKENAFAGENGTVTDKVYEQILRSYLEENSKKETKNYKETEKKSSKLEFSGNSAVYLLQLEHR